MKKSKRSKGRQKSKAALLTAQAKEAQYETSENSSGTDLGAREYSGGMMTKMRGGFKAAVSTEEQAKGSWANIILWVAVIGASIFFFSGQYQ